MRIAIIGAGRVGATLGSRWQSTGHDIVYGVRDPSDPRHGGIGAVDVPGAAAHDADVVVVALPWEATPQVVDGLDVGDAVVIDTTNPLAGSTGGRPPDRAPSGSELIAGWLPSDRVVKAFNTTGSANMADPGYAAGVPLMPVAGDDAEAKRIVLGLAAEIGFDGLDAGPLAAADDLEHLAALWIRLAYPLGQGPDIAVSLLRR